MQLQLFQIPIYLITISVKFNLIYYYFFITTEVNSFGYNSIPTKFKSLG